MSTVLKLIYVFLVICFASQAFGKCGPSEIIIRQSSTGKYIEDLPEFEVSVSNSCPCSQSNVIVDCYGLSSSEPVDPNAIKTLDVVRCIVNNGNAISPGSPIKFKYAWLTIQDFSVVSTMSSC